MNDQAPLSHPGGHPGGFDTAIAECRPQPRAEGRVRLQSRAGQALEQGRARLIVTSALFGLAFVSVGVRLIDATVLSQGHEPPSPRVAGTTAPVSRADIVDRNGVLLATSLSTASLYADPKLVLDAEDTARQLAAALPDVNAAHLLAELKSDKRFIWIKRNLTPRQEYEVNRLGLPGVAFQKEERRIYPQGALMAHVVGFTSVDGAGLSGIEQSQDGRLKTGTEPLQLSIDVRLQHILKREIQGAIETFDAIGGAGIVMDANTSEVLAMVSLPDFDPQAPGEVSEDLRFNRTTLGVYEQGSTFKIFNTAMALDSGQVRISDFFDYKPIRVGRFTINDYHPEHQAMDVPYIFKESSNIGSVHMAERVGPAHQRDFMAKMGMLKPATVELPEVGWPLVPNPWKEVNMMTVAFGHGLSVSPMQLVNGVAAVVNGGILRPATLMKRDPAMVLTGTRVIRPETSDALRRLMRLVVTDGTAKMSEAPGWLLGGKTGTSDKNKAGGYDRKARLSSFCGAFPMNDPKYVVYVMIDEPKGTKKTYGFATGGWVAAPAVSRIVQQIGPLLGVRPVDQAAPDVAQAMSIDAIHIPRISAVSN